MALKTIINYTLILVFYGCSSSPSVDIPVTARDTTITIENAFTLATLDSQVVETYLDTATITDTSRVLFRNFYNSRNYQYAWIDESGITEHASMLWNLYKEFREYALNAPQLDSSVYNQINQLLTDSSLEFVARSRLEVELVLTKLFFDYAFAKYIGDVNPAELQWYIPRKKVNVSRLLDTLISSNSSMHDWEPLHPQYRLLKGKLFEFILIAEKGGWDSIPLPSDKMKNDDRDSLVIRLKRRLQTTFDYPSADTTAQLTKAFRDSIKIVQQQFGLKVDGSISRELVAELNIPVEIRMQQILINMERMRWLPRRPDSIWILVNIPSFTLQVLHRDSLLMKMNIVVGTETRKTVIFSDDLKYIVFSPYWNVPASIVKNEILPALKKNPRYLLKSQMEKIGTSQGLPVIRQLPGPNNALGKVKFLFPNNYNIYLHDTPAKSLFDKNVRAFSHGCVRVQKPYDLAKFLLRNDSSWNEKSITKAMNSRRETWVTLSKTVPVFITYFTAWVEPNSRINFRKDIYGHDQRMSDHLFSATVER